MAIKPSGVDYNEMSLDDKVVVDLQTGEAVDGKWKPSSDTVMHLELYSRYKDIAGVVFTHSVKAVAFAQADKTIPALETTHADYFYGDIPCTRELTEQEVNEAYELNTSKVTIEVIDGLAIDPTAVPGIAVKSHGPFA